MTISSGSLKVSNLSPVVLEEPGDVSVGLSIRLHPLPIISMSEHIVRTAVQQDTKNVQVIGALLGSQMGREIEIQTTFEVLATTAGGQGDLQIDQTFLASRLAQFKQVFPTFDLLGWYSNGPVPLLSHLAIHRQFLEHNESPLFLQVSPVQSSMNQARAKGELPIGIYETFVDITNSIQNGASSSANRVSDGPAMFFRPAHFQVETGEAERIAVDHASKPPMTEGTGQSSLIANLITKQNAVKMLSDRIALLRGYVADVEAGRAPRDHEAIRQIASLLAGLPASAELPEFQQEFQTEYDDLLLTTYLADMTAGLGTLNEMVDKFDLAQASNEGGLGGAGLAGAFSSRTGHGGGGRIGRAMQV